MYCVYNFSINKYLYSTVDEIQVACYKIIVLIVIDYCFDWKKQYYWFNCYSTVDEIQVACYKILAALYQLGTDLTLDKSRKFIKIALDRNRPAIGTCLGAFAATFPVAFLEPPMNKQNPFSIHNRIADQSLEAQGQLIYRKLFRRNVLFMFV